MAALLARAAATAAAFRAGLPDRPVPAADPQRSAAAFDRPLPQAPTPPAQVLDELVAAAEDGLMATPGPRYFGFVVGGALASATAAEMLAAGWDQCAFNTALSPAASAAERAAGRWLLELLGLPATASVGFVTGGQAANTVGLAAARHHVLAEAGWDVERDGLAGAPRVRVVAGVERHATIDRSLRLLGLGSAALQPVAADGNGAIDVRDLQRVLAAAAPGPTVVCLQAGNVNTGACDDLRTAIGLAHDHGAWVHVDGAFGLWAAADPARAHLVAGVELADSWACDGHKWLNLPYDSGFAICSRPGVHVAALSYTASYLTGSGSADPAPADLTPESSRRARGFAAWAGLRELGAGGVAALVARCCALAVRFAGGLAAGGARIANDVVLNQVLVRFGDDGEAGDARTDRVLEAVQRDGTCWMGGTTWRGRRYMRIAVSNATTTEADVDRSVAAVLRAARAC
ncbi:pyridoxal phosphate-dependent decarboxylase family protein [Pseudonocardia acidicola]|uniref:Aspartate aminotransferase family protein n=1 Tax=Pseudonocardia acidicola TaxID=2724939 RepID=A0ABX1S841_9PSEU|nr:aminotransferase class V-fold PLP-dependent enzyme [Pseudonocardia acidicola]NMH97730.1 aspartate aminotransferase family protein [Pseudonocardia acidicola]